ncbi:hypothetical protein F443_03703 [Phytophthora nicotianae P1569]|uniref:Reverse transcriptase domain-containing protein n=1 Tax=Phytophthora nicotianae P1569 TaxID=1317065 RepID=V9FPA5_PHYNI|nr:hypothetical protein F443_03703 [Phytophthora nicotianae P1569]
MTNQRHRTALNHDALIVEKLSGDPQLLDRFLQVREASGKHSDIAREGNRRSTDLDVEEKRAPEKRWSEAEVASLVYWINDLLEEFRGAAENGDDFRQVRTRCSTDDRLLKDLMFVKVHRQVDTLRAETVAEDTRCQEQRPAAASRQQPSLAEKKRLGRIPRDVLRRLPVQVDPATGETTALCEAIEDGRPNKALDPYRLRTSTALTWNGDRDRKHDDHRQTITDRADGIYVRYLEAFATAKTQGIHLEPSKKKDADPNEAVRTSHDLSFPKNDSVNSSFITDSVPRVCYESVVRIARRIENLTNSGYEGRIFMLKGDVKGAFRHLRVRANQVFRIAACLKELGIIIIGMVAPFGWAGSPPCYA